MKIVYTNTDTLTNQIRELIQIVNDMKTEVRPKYSVCEVCSQQFKIEGFDLFTNADDIDVGRDQI